MTADCGADGTLTLQSGITQEAQLHRDDPGGITRLFGPDAHA